MAITPRPNTSLRHWLTKSNTLFALKQELDMIPAILSRKDSTSRSWSQYGEDDIFCTELSKLIQTGYYIDIGANHPTKLSNTYRLYRMGMRGIAVEPNQVLCGLHSKYRPEDVQLCAGVGEQDGLATFYKLSSHVLSTFSRIECEQSVHSGYTVISSSLVPVFTLRTILKHCPFVDRKTFALLSIDTEGLDETVLRSNDWSTHRPRIISIENNKHAASARYFLGQFDYTLLASRGCNEIFKLT